MKRTGITRERVFLQLLNQSIRQLGEVKRLYFEAEVTFSTVKNYDIEPGLPILPISYKEYQENVSENSDELVCEQCGWMLTGEHNSEPCRNCGNKTDINAVN